MKKKRRKGRVQPPKKKGPYMVVSAMQTAGPGVYYGWGFPNLPSPDWGVLLALTMPKGNWGVYSRDDPHRLLYTNLPRYYNDLGRGRN